MQPFSTTSNIHWRGCNGKNRGTFQILKDSPFLLLFHLFAVQFLKYNFILIFLLSSSCFVQVVKRLWNHIRENNLQDPKNKRNIICDESLHALFCVDSIDMFQMNKALSKHIWPLNDEAGISFKLFSLLDKIMAQLSKRI